MPLEQKLDKQLSPAPQSAVAEQGKPDALAPHVPATQCSERQAPSMVHLAPAPPSVPASHMPVLHAPLPQSPGKRHGPPGSLVSHRPSALHLPERQSVPWAHAPPPPSSSPGSVGFVQPPAPQVSSTQS